MGNLVIAAIPEANDRVWKISSEKIPHLTLLFLGETEKVENLEEIYRFVQHAVNVSEHGSFMLEVDRRDILGDDKADVLHFSKDWSFRWIDHFRSQLLQNSAIRTAYDSTEQFPEWQPHLTLGYPETPAKENDDEHRLAWVTFDRIAVWTGNYEGPEFRLRWPERQLEEVRMSSVTKTGESVVGDILHFGVKGMRWGQRKTETITTSSGRTKLVTSKKAAKLDAKWEKNQFTLPKGIERHNAMAAHFNSRIGTLNDKYKKDDFSKEDWENPSSWSPKFKQYNKEIAALEEAGFRKAVEQVHGTSPTGKKKAAVEVRGDSLQLVIKNTDAKHAAIEEDDEVFLFRLTRNAQGLITKVEPVEDSMEQTADLGEEFVAHVGVKGMRWGVRKERPPGKLRRAAKGTSTFVKDVHFESRDARPLVARAAQKAYKNDLKAMNAKPEYQAARKTTNRLRNPKDPITKQYRKEAREAYIKRLEEAANSMTNASGNRQYTIRERGIDLPGQGGALPQSRYFWDVTARDVQHAESDTKDFLRLEVILDDDGFIVDIKQLDDEDTSLAQTALNGAEFLEHYGIKGMQWGRRKPPPAPVAPSAKSVVPHGAKKKTKIKAEGGENHPASEDAIKVAVAKAKLQKSGTAALSNAELREVATRLQLEQQVKQMTQSGGKKFVSNILRTQGQNEINTAFNTNRQIRTQSKMRKAQPA